MRTLLGNRIYINPREDAAKFMVEKYKTVLLAGNLPSEDGYADAGYFVQTFTGHSCKVGIFTSRQGVVDLQTDWAYEYDRIPSRVEIEQDLGTLYHYEKEDNK